MEAGSSIEGRASPEDVARLWRSACNRPEFDLRELDRWRCDHLGRLLVRAVEAFERDVLDGFRARGIDDLERADLPVLRNLSLEGSRIVEIADRAGLSKQTIGPLVRELAEKGVLRVEPDPTDGRAKVVRLTEEGFRRLAIAVEVIRDTIARYTEILGTERMEGLRDALHELLERVEARDAGCREGDG